MSTLTGCVWQVSNTPTQFNQPSPRMFPEINAALLKFYSHFCHSTHRNALPVPKQAAFLSSDLILDQSVRYAWVSQS